VPRVTDQGNRAATDYLCRAVAGFAAWCIVPVQLDQHGVADIGSKGQLNGCQIDAMAVCGAWEDPAFLKPFEEKGAGEKVTVQEGDAKSVNIVTIKSVSTEQQKP